MNRKDLDKRGGREVMGHYSETIGNEDRHLEEVNSCSGSIVVGVPGEGSALTFLILGILNLVALTFTL